MQDPLLHWNSSTFLFEIQEQGKGALSCAQINLTLQSVKLSSDVSEDAKVILDNDTNKTK